MQSSDRNGFVIEDGDSMHGERAGKTYSWIQRPSNDPMANFQVYCETSNIVTQDGTKGLLSQ